MEANTFYRILFIIGVFFQITAFAQVELLTYEEKQNEIVLTLDLDSVTLLELGEKVGYWDESKPGYFALPSKSIIIGIPFCENFDIASEILDETTKEFSLGINPSISKNEEYLEYNFLPKNLFKENPKKDVEIKGTFWSNGIYCVHIQINQYKFDDIKKEITTINKLRISVKSKGNFNYSKLLKSNIKNQLIEYILNNIYAERYITNQSLSFENDTTDNWIDYNAVYVKLGVSEDGVYRVNYEDFSNFGIDASNIILDNIKLFSKGKQIPIYVYNDDSDFYFSLGDYIEFVGLRNMGGKHREISSYDEPYNEYLGRYTDTTIYWITWNNEKGLRVPVVKESINNIKDTLEYYYETIHSELNGWYNFSLASQVRRELPYWIENKSWFEGNLTIGTKIKEFSVSDIYPNKSFEIYSKMQDYVSDINSRAHLVAIGLNSSGGIYDSTYIDKYQKVVLNVSLNSNILKEGKNSVEFHSFQTNASVNACVFDWFEIEYPRYLVPLESNLIFSFPFLSDLSIRNIKLQNIEDDSFVLWRYGDSYRKYLFSKLDKQILFSDTVSNESKFIYSSVDRIKTPKFYYKKKFVNLRNDQNNAYYLAITHPKFSSKVNEYTKFIADQYNVTTKVIDINDIYDEYAFGFFYPEAIRNFLRSTHTYWNNNPKYVCLFGGATYDYYGNKHKYVSSVKERVINYVPSFGAPASDSWFVTWDSTGAYIPQMNIGRLPITSNAELDWYLKKHKEYVSQDYDDWNKRFMFFSSGDASSESELTLLKESNQFVIDNYVNLPTLGGQAEHFYKTIDPATNFGPYSTEYFNKAVSRGSVFISYLGHSGTQIWDNSITSPNQLSTDDGRYTIVSDFGCSTGKFAEPDVRSFSEMFTLDDNAQAMCYIGNSSLGFLSTSSLMPKMFYKKILSEKIFNVSEAHKEAKLEMLTNYGSSGVYELFALTNTFIGDPILSLPIPDKLNFVIDNSCIKTINSNISDMLDNFKLSVTIKNFGTVIQDSVDVLVLHEYQGEIDSIFNKIKIPTFIDSFFVSINVKNKAGDHKLQVFIDKDDKFEEIYKTDNYASYDFTVNSSSIRPLYYVGPELSIGDSIRFLNPSLQPSSSLFDIELSYNDAFTNSSIYNINFGEVVSWFDLSNSKLQNRMWLRTRLLNSDVYSEISTFSSNKNKYVLFDSLSFSNSQKENVNFKHGISIDSSFVKFELFSAGFEDGQAAIISRNGIDYVPTPKVGHQVAVFSSVPPYNFESFHYFNTLAGGENITNYINFLDTLSSDKIVAFAISDEGASQVTSELKNKIKQFGSQYIGKIKWRSSWAMIGWKGAEQGTVPEAFSLAGNGSVTVDTAITYLSDNGSILTSEIGPVGKWDKLVVNQEMPSNSKISYTPIGIRTDSVLDTLSELTFQDSVADLSFLDADIYNKIKILADFTSSDDNQSPILKSLGVDYTGVPELATNYQVVSVSADSVDQGKEIGLDYQIWNVGESEADSFRVMLDLVNFKNVSSNLVDTVFTSLLADGKLKLHYEYESNFDDGYGDMEFKLTIDTEDNVLEMFEDNNIYSQPFYVIKDTVTAVNENYVSVLFDDRDIFDGEFIDPESEVKININYGRGFDLADTAAFHVFVDDRRIPSTMYKQSKTETDGTLEYVLESKFENGEHIFEIRGENLIGNLKDGSGYKKSFNVSDEIKLIDVYNYPNPFKDDTYFTFKLPKIPDEAYILIYTIAGRLVRKIELMPDQLKLDFNKIEWDGRDQDGDLIANGTYLYKIVIKKDGESFGTTEKLSVLR